MWSAGRVETLAAPPARPPLVAGEPESDVALIKTYPGMDSVLLTAVVDAGARGVVLEGTGLGNVPVDLFATIGELSEWGIPVVIASRMPHARGAARRPALPSRASPASWGRSEPGAWRPRRHGAR